MLRHTTSTLKFEVLTGYFVLFWGFVRSELPTGNLVRLTASFRLASRLCFRIDNVHFLFFLVLFTYAAAELREHRGLSNFLWRCFQPRQVLLAWGCLDSTYLKRSLRPSILCINEFSPGIGGIVNQHILWELVVFCHFWAVHSDPLMWLLQISSITRQKNLVWTLWHLRIWNLIWFLHCWPTELQILLSRHFWYFIEAPVRHLR